MELVFQAECLTPSPKTQRNLNRMDRELATEGMVVAQDVDSPEIEATSNEYLGRWHHLVSTTNWEKGRIICEWRAALIEAAAPAASSTDEAWSRRVGNVTPQHTGRLRRVYQRFGQVRDQYAGLYWSHFQIALDWNDAEMWLEGAVQNGWSVAQMQGQRAMTLDTLDGQAAEQDALAAEIDEDAPAEAAGLPDSISATTAEVRAADDVPGDEPPADYLDSADAAPFEAADSLADQPPAELVRPFENLAALPADLQEAFEAFKLAIVHHRLCGWQEVSRDDVLGALDALKQLALAPAGE
jgi:hypothetical protein